MSTRSAIAVYNRANENKITSIYCHHDGNPYGYPESVGQTLFEHYQSITKINALVSLGSLSVLAPQVHPTVGSKSKPHTFDAPQRSVSIAYHRDRGDDWDVNKPLKHASYHNLVHVRKDSVPYIYLFMGGEWGVWFQDDDRWDRLEDVIRFSELLKD